MQGIYYLLSIVAVFVVFVWYIRNEGLADGVRTRGWLAIKETDTDQPEKPKQRWRHRREL